MSSGHCRLTLIALALGLALAAAAPPAQATNNSPPACATAFAAPTKRRIAPP
jgi:hypothetical protein